ncbi:hypothetical protein PF001_g33271 [Phytophthora fragariae]|uniref:Uncharacterized protein n=1 Tax=Phytophthora fragariae TaxID=53985 RepID=A0A6A4AJY7_9STRA|nr:hypothetical protein PF001_g33271 [Phytophthora fragariae]
MADTIRDAAFEPGRSQPDDSNCTVNLTEDNEASQTPEPSTVPAVVGGKKRDHPVHDCWGHITDTI